MKYFTANQGQMFKFFEILSEYVIKLSIICVVLWNS